MCDNFYPDLCGSLNFRPVQGNLRLYMIMVTMDWVLSVKPLIELNNNTVSIACDLKYLNTRIDRFVDKRMTCNQPEGVVVNQAGEQIILFLLSGNKVLDAQAIRIFKSSARNMIHVIGRNSLLN